MSQPALVILEGNISAGKSTLTQDLSNLLPGYRVFLEPTITNPYLEKFYKEPKKYALRMQMWLLRQRFTMYIEAIKHMLETGEGVILDRSVFSDSVFAVKNRVDGNITEEGYEYYLMQRNKMLSCIPVPSLTLFLNVSPEKCHERIHGLRQRDCETGIPLDYLAGLHDCYLEFTRDMQQLGSHVILLDWNNFGESGDVAQHIDSTPGRELSHADIEQLRYFVYNEQAVLEAITPDYIFEDAMDYEDYAPDAFAKIDLVQAHQLELDLAMQEQKRAATTATQAPATTTAQIV